MTWLNTKDLDILDLLLKHLTHPSRLRSDHELKRRFVFLGIEQIPDIFSGGSIVLLKDVRDNFIIFASKLWIDENKIVYMFWQNENYSPNQYYKFLNER